MKFWAQLKIIFSMVSSQTFFSNKVWPWRNPRKFFEKMIFEKKIWKICFGHVSKHKKKTKEILSLDLEQKYFSDSSTQTKKIFFRFLDPNKKIFLKSWFVLNFWSIFTKQKICMWNEMLVNYFWINSSWHKYLPSAWHFHDKFLMLFFRFDQLFQSAESRSWKWNKIVSEQSETKIIFRSDHKQKYFSDSSTQTKKIFLNSSTQTKKIFFRFLDPNKKNIFKFHQQKIFQNPKSRKQKNIFDSPNSKQKIFSNSSNPNKKNIFKFLEPKQKKYF